MAADKSDLAGSNEWLTPDDVLEAVRRFAPIGLDPCSHPLSRVHADREVRKDLGEDGLKVSWINECPLGRLVFVNPPYCQGIGDWTAKARYQGEAGAFVVGLLPAHTDTGWWHRDVVPATAVCLWRGRVSFRGPQGQDLGPARFPSAVVLWSKRQRGRLRPDPVLERFAWAFEQQGWVVPGSWFREWRNQVQGEFTFPT